MIKSILTVGSPIQEELGTMIQSSLAVGSPMQEELP